MYIFYEVIDIVKSEMETHFENKDNLIKAKAFELNYNGFETRKELNTNYNNPFSKEETICIKNY